MADKGIGKLRIACLNFHFLFDFQSKTASMQFCFVGCGGNAVLLASRNASHFGATSCRAIPIPDKIMANLIWNWNYTPAHCRPVNLLSNLQK
jgi:hypothetical protein